jgi:ubiquinone/menaquinone biosynthesis C-methylase UbiE
MEGVDHQEAVQRYARVFDSVASDYDNVGVDFFGPIARVLVDGAKPVPGERVLDLGCGAGAATALLARGVAPGGHVTGLDISDGMLARARTALADAGFGADAVTFQVGNAADPALPSGAFDLVTASLVVFFLPDPPAAVRRWVELLTPGGRIALTTFGSSNETWRAAESELDPWRSGPRPRRDGGSSPFGRPEGMRELFGEAGASRVRTTTERIAVSFPDFEHYLGWSRSSAQRLAWDAMPDATRTEVAAAMRAHLAPVTAADGRIDVWQDVLTTVAFES